VGVALHPREASGVSWRRDPRVWSIDPCSRSQLGRKWLLVALVVLAAVPLLVALYQFVLITLFYRHNHYDECAPFFPRTAILLPAWNEAAVIGTSIDRLMLLDYPMDSLRIY